MATPTIYTSADASAPVLTGEVGKLVALLDAVLVNGYGAKAAAGWSKEYSATNYAAYRQGGASGLYLWVNDSNAQLARVVGYKVMTDILSGTGPFPTDAQFSGGLYCRKSVSANSTTRPWIAYATNRVFHLFIQGGSTTFGTYGGGDSSLSFGVLDSVIAGDVNAGFIMGATDTSPSSTSATLLRIPQPAYSTAVLAGHYLAGSYSQSGGAIAFAKRGNSLYVQSNSGGAAVAYPEPATGGLHISEITALETGMITRGRIPGLWNLGHAYTYFTHLDTFSGAGALTGKTFQIVLMGTYGMVIETSGGW